MKTYEFRVSLDVETNADENASPEFMRGQLIYALAAQFADQFVGDEDEYEVMDWSVDIQDPETKVPEYTTWWHPA
jgi:hypothetical protein